VPNVNPKGAPVIREERAAIFATDCLGCRAPEGGFHGQDCPAMDESKPSKLLTIDVKTLIRQYGLEPRWATIDRGGLLTIAGRSKEK
jgi:hypothetical protein